MKHFHVHLHVTDLNQNIRFYSAMFDQPPTRVEADYAKWMLSDPPVNFAISTRGSVPGVDHLGIQVDSTEELAALKRHAAKADRALLDEDETSCCYARSEKHWVTDPQGLAWEQFHTLDSIPVFSESPATPGSACCAPKAVALPLAASCCAPAASGSSCCCPP